MTIRTFDDQWEAAAMILNTGGLGFIGSHVTRALLDLGESCVLLQRRTSGPSELIAGDEGARLVIEQADVADQDALGDIADRHKITGIVHLAGGFGLDASDPIGGARRGTEGLLNVFQLAAEQGMTRVGVASTIGVYDGPGESPLREDLPLPLTAVHPIPAAKKVHELLADFVANGTGLEIYLMRIGAVWGPLGRPASRFFAAPQLVHAAVSGRALDQPPYAADGADLIYARDCGRAIALLQLAERLSHRTYNVSGGRFTSNAELTAAIADVVPGACPGLRDGRDPHGLGRDIYLDISRLREDAGFEPGYDIPAAVADYVGWLRSGHGR
jgi:UDP-glucose 4-epimerase